MKKIGFIGVGKMGLSHLAIANRLEGVNVSAISDSSKLLLIGLNKGIKGATYTDYKKMVHEEALDAVVISLPNSLHYEAVRTCLNNGLNVFIEKPFTLKPEHSAELIALANNKGLVIQVGYVNRFCDTFQYVRALLKQNVLGKILKYQSYMTGPVITESHEQGWRNDYNKGGGCLNDYGPHCIDLICFLFGNEFDVEHARLTSVYSTQVDDIVDATFKHSSFSGDVHINWSDDTVRKASNRVCIELEHGRIEVSKQELTIESAFDIEAFSLVKGENRKYITDFSTDVGFYLRGEEFSRQLHEFVHVINGNESDICDVRAAYKVDQTIADIFSKCGK